MIQPKSIYFFHSTPLSLSFLETGGLKIIAFETTLPCIEAALKSVPDMIILDLDREHDSALKIINTFRMPQIYKKFAFPLLVLKTHISSNDVKTLSEAGVNALITKPFMISSLKSRLNRLLSEKLEMREIEGNMRPVPQFSYENEVKLTPNREVQTWLV
jgi:response regulator RpfG family c-di-GMP phosphodiesterase